MDKDAPLSERPEAELGGLNAARVLSATFLGGMLALSILIYWNDYRVEVRKAEELVLALTQAADEQLSGSLRTIDLLLQHVGRYLAPTRLGDPHPIYESLNLQARAFPEVESLFVVDADGTRVGTTRQGDVSDRNYFLYQKFLFEQNRVVIDGPDLSQGTGKPEIVLSRPMVDADGRFKGVVAASLKPDFFDNPLASVGLEGQGIAIVLNSNGVVLSRFPEADKWIGRSVADGTIVATLLPKARSGVFRTHGDTDGVDQITAYRSLSNYPLVVAVGMPIAQLHTRWWTATAYKIGIEFAFALLLVYLAYQLDKRERQRRRIAIDLLRLNEELEGRVAERTGHLMTEMAERARADAALVRAKEAYQGLFEGAIEGLLIHRDFRPLLANESCARMFGFDSARDVLALPSVMALVAEEDRERVAGIVMSRMRGENPPAVFEFQGVRRDGTPIWCLNSGRRVEWDGAPAIQAAFMDITASKRTERGLQQAKDEAEQASRSKTRFLAAASHDLRQPVQALNLYINVLAQRRHAPEVHEIIERIQGSASALGDLLNALLDISKLEAGLVRPEPRSFRLAPLMERLWAEFAAEGEATGVSVSVVPSQAFVRSDPTLLERILQNLMSNAIRYAPGGKVLVGCRRRGGALLLQVRDTGVGIPPDQLDAIFEEFFQLGNVARDRRHGLGLGLAIVRRLAALLGHGILVRSEVGRGSLFQVELPLGEDQEEPEAVLPFSGNIDLDGKRVLVIDDDFDVRDGLRRQMEAWGCRVVASGSAQEALEALDQGPPDIVVADYRLRSGETGIDAVEAIAARFSIRLPAILLTGDTAPDRLRDARESGYRLLHKPVRPEDLRRALATGLPTVMPGGERGECE